MFMQLFNLLHSPPVQQHVHWEQHFQKPQPATAETLFNESNVWWEITPTTIRVLEFVRRQVDRRKECLSHTQVRGHADTCSNY